MPYILTPRWVAYRVLHDASSGGAIVERTMASRMSAEMGRDVANRLRVHGRSITRPSSGMPPRPKDAARASTVARMASFSSITFSRAAARRAGL